MELFIYIAKVSAFWIALYACYWFILRQHTFFRWNRFFLIGSLLLSFVLPLVTYPEAAPELPVYEVSAVSYVVVAAQSPSLLTWVNLVWALYAAGVLFMSLRLFVHFRRLGSFIRKGERIVLDECTLVLMDDDRVGSFSFLNWVVISRTDYEQHFDTILNHEMVHVEQRHSLDILLVEVLHVLLWFNPILIFYKQSFQQVHEYLADRQAAIKGLTPSRDTYAEFLVAYALGAPVAALTNHFFNTSLLKSRITMLYKNKNSNWSLSKYAAVALFISMISLVVASCEREVVPTATNNSDKNVTGKINVEGIVKGPDGKPLQGALITDASQKLGTNTDAEGKFKIKVPVGTDLKVAYPGIGEVDLMVSPKFKNVTYDIAMVPGGIKSGVVATVPMADGAAVKVTMRSPTINGETVYMVVEKSPEFPGGIEAMFKYLGENIKYPAAATRANVQGEVFASFVVSTQGEIKDIQILKGIGFGADEESIRVVSAMPRWTPGMQDGKPVNVRYNVPIAFQLDADGSPKVSYTVSESDAPMIGAPKGRPLVVVDGIEKGKEFSLNDMDPKTIDKVSVLKGKKATDKYGDKGANGVVEITTKKQ
jgi:TonB family protein